MKRALTILLMAAMLLVLGIPVMAQQKELPLVIEPSVIPPPPSTLIGVYLPMTGAAASYGQSTWEGIKAANEMMPQVSGRDVRLFLADTKSDKKEAANAVDRLITKDKVMAIIGEAFSSFSIAGGPVGEKNEIPMVTPTATNPVVTQGKKYYFRVCFTDPFQGEIAALLATMNLRAKTAVTIVDVTHEYCVGLGNYFVSSFTKLGGKVLHTNYIKTGDTDFRRELSQAQAAHVDLIYAPNYYAEVALLAKQAKELGINIPILTGDAAQLYDLIKIGGPAVEGMYFTAFFHEAAMTTPLGKDFLAFFKKKFNKELDGNSAMGGEAYFFLMDALRRAKSDRGPDIREALATTRDFQGLFGKVSMGEEGNAVRAVVINQVKDGKFTYVTSISPP